MRSSTKWAAAFPLQDLVRHDLIDAAPTRAGTVAALLRYFRVSNPDATRRCRATPLLGVVLEPLTDAASPSVISRLADELFGAHASRTQLLEVVRRCDYLSHLGALTATP